MYNLLTELEGLSYLHGESDYGDSVEDEWLIVFMLRKLTQAFTSLWVRVSDTDGEFLLIEAANVLPKWLTPEMDRNRVWIHDNKLFLIPVIEAKNQAVQSKILSIRDAVEHIKSRPESLVQSPFIEAEAFYRLEKYPTHITDSLHYSILTIPRKLAFILHELPKTVSPAVEAFYLRDAFSLKRVLSSSEPLKFPPEDLVQTSVKFSKVLFAQLRSQRFETPPRWQAVAPLSTSSFVTQQHIPAFELGMKLTCGFEMLAYNADRHKSRNVRALAIALEDLEEDGSMALPSNDVIQSWPDSQRNDDESWMDIDYAEFERELDGRNAQGAAESGAGFGDSQAQANLRKIVSRFEAFLNDDKANIDGVDLDEMDNADDEDNDTDSEEDSEYEDKEVSFNEDAFAQMMRDMMGFPEDSPEQRSKTPTTRNITSEQPLAQSLHLEESELQELSSQMEAELKAQGALKLDHGSGGQSKLPERAQNEDANTSDNNEESGEVSIDYNMAQNLLESFKSQAGMAGPAGNLMGMMGLQLPRDEIDEQDED